MSEASAEPARKPSRPLNRWGIGTLSIIQIALLATILLCANYLGSLHFQKIDLSRDGNYSLSEATRSYLKGPDLKAHPQPVKWIMAFRRNSPYYERVRVLAEDYERRSKGKITLEIVDPLRSPDRTQAILANYGISLVRDLIIMDARTDESAPLLTSSAGTRALNPHIKLAVADDMVVYSVDDKQQRKAIGFRGEDVLTARLVEAIEGKPRKMLFLADKSRIDADGEDSPWRALENTLRFQNIELAPVNLSGLAEIPADAEGVALVAPRYDLTDEEAAVLEAYWARPKAAILVILRPGDTPPKLRAFLRGNGITPRKDRIVINEGGRIISRVRGTFSPGVEFLRDLGGQSTFFEGATSSLEVRESASDLLDRKLFPLSLIQSEAGFWGESKFGDGKESYSEIEDQRGPLSIAAGVTRGAATDDRFAADTSRMIVLANTDFLSPEHQHASNIDFLASSVNWLVGRESLSGIGPHPLGTYKLPLFDAQISFINRVNLFFIPAFLVVIGAFIWSSRRS